jgi:hypothetical protein
MDFATLIRFVVPALQAILPTVDPSTPAGKIAQIVLKVLPLFGTQAARFAATSSMPPEAFGAMPPVDLPPEEHWTPEGLLEYAESLPTT